MPPAELSRLADHLWLAAHDSVNDKSCIGEWPLGVGVATALLAELVHDRFLELREGELFRTTQAPLNDPALSPLLVTMQAEERDRPSPVPLARVRASERDGWARSVSNGQDWPAASSDRRSWHPAARQDWSPQPGPDETRHRMHGHELGTWISYLAHSRRAEKLVTERLARAGLVERQEHRRLLRGTTERFVPHDSVVAGNPANVITTTVQRGMKLPLPGLLLAGLFLTTGLHHHALATLEPPERARLEDQIRRGLPGPLQELLWAADAAVGEAAMR